MKQTQTNTQAIDAFYIIEKLVSFSFYSAMIKLVWGIVFLYPDNTFAVNPISYAGMAAIATENHWGILLLILGVYHTFTLFYTNLKMRIIAQISSVFIWLFIATQFWMSNPIGTGKFTYGIAAIIDFLAIIYILKYKGGRYE